jgi:surface antigen
VRGGAFAASCIAAAIWLAAGAQAASLGGNCVAYARDVSGISLDGDAGSWWSQAEGRYERSQTPAVGAVLVFRPSGHMRVGHVAVVSRVVKPREILVDQANWVRGRVVKGMSVVDASPNNDWTVVKVVELHSGTHGRPNQTYGFVYPRPPRPSGSDTLIAAGGDEKSRAKLPVQLAVARGSDAPAEVAMPPAANASAAKPHENAKPAKDQPQRSAAMRAHDHPAKAAKPSAANSPKDHPNPRRGGAVAEPDTSRRGAAAEKRASPRLDRLATATTSKKATKARAAD